MPGKKIIQSSLLPTIQAKIVGLSDSMDAKQRKIEIQSEIDALLKRVSDLSQQVLSLDSGSRGSLNENEYANKLAQKYPFMYILPCASNATYIEVGVHNASWFFTSSSDKYLYSSSPVQCHSLLVSKQGILKYNKHPEDSAFIPENTQASSVLNDYTVSNGYNMLDDVDILSGDVRSTRYGHPHVQFSYSQDSVDYSEHSNQICFGSNTGINDMLYNASTQADFTMILERLWAWLTEIYFGSVYHKDIVPLSPYMSFATEFGELASDLCAPAQEIVESDQYSDFIKMLHAGANSHAGIDERTWADVTMPMLKLVHDRMTDALDKYGDYEDSATRLVHYILTFSATQWLRQEPGAMLVPLECVICLHQLLSGIILSGKYNWDMENGIYRAILADLFVMCGAWREEIVMYPRRLVRGTSVWQRKLVSEANSGAFIIPGHAAWRTILRYFENTPELVG